MNIKQSVGQGGLHSIGSRVVGAMVLVSAMWLTPGPAEDQQIKLGLMGCHETTGISSYSSDNPQPWRLFRFGEGRNLHTRVQ